MQQPTLADIAERCQVSIMTVSRVVRGMGGVVAEKRARIEKALRELDYQPNPHSRILANNRQKVRSSPQGSQATIAYLDADRSGYSQDMYQILVEEARMLGYRLEYHLLPHTVSEQARMSRKLYYQGIRGAILGPAQNEERLEGFDVSLFTIVSIGALEHMPAINSVSQDYFQGLYLAATKCVELGLKRIGLFLDRETEVRTGHRWLGAYYAFCSDRGIEPHVYLDERKSPPGRVRMRSWVKQRKLDVLMTLYGNCQRNKLWPEVIPQTRLVLLSDLIVPENWWNVSTPLRLIAGETVNLLNQQLIQQKYGPPPWAKQVLIRSQWNES